LFGVAPRAEAQTDVGNDFVQGSRVLYQTDFSTVTVGMFPRSLRLVDGNAEVAKVDGRSVLRITGQPTTVTIPLTSVLPERFTLEFMLNGLEWDQVVWFVTPETDEADYVSIAFDDAGLMNNARAFTAQPGLDSTTQWVPVQVMADGAYTKVYVNGRRVANVPTANIGRSNAIHLVLYGSSEDPVMITQVRVAAGGKDLYRALMEDGRMTLEGIEFDSGSDRLRPTSDSTLRQVAAALVAKPELRVEVEGHTDGVGEEAANLVLSQRRAKSVLDRLVALGVPAAQLTSAGYGASRPIASNETPDGRQRNRRVELVRPE
jgi:outer membrane protein OmpA-like peptidoglycan-associated protein